MTGTVVCFGVGEAGEQCWLWAKLRSTFSETYQTRSRSRGSRSGHP
jgi:hypothetical protein